VRVTEVAWPARWGPVQTSGGWIRPAERTIGGCQAL